MGIAAMTAALAVGAGQAQVQVSIGDRDTDPPAPWAQKDPADSLYKAARETLNKNNYRRSADLFGQIVKRYPKSVYAGDALYWQAFALYRLGGTEDLKTAQKALDTQQKSYPKAGTRGDAAALATRIRGELARRGDAGAAEDITRRAGEAATPPVPPTPPTAPTPPVPPVPPTLPVPPAPPGSRVSSEDCDEEDDTRIAALNALLQMDADRAMPILKKVLARRDPPSVCLRRKAVFLVSQKKTDETENILLAAARSDPDAEVREQSVFWLSQVGTERAVSALDSILQASKDEEIQKKALFALSQTGSPKAGQALRSYAQRTDVSEDVQEEAVFWLGQQGGKDNVEFLRGLFKRAKSDQVREKILFSLSQTRDPDSGRWLLDVAQDGTEDIEMRKKALFWAGQSGVSIEELTGLYGRLKDAEMKEQLIFALSQRNEKAAVDKLIDIAKTDPDREMRKKALFWVSQSHDPRVSQLLQDILEQ
jgi:HEAT repeat protein